MTSGKIGIFKIGDKQIGGFLDWEIHVAIDGDKSKTTACAQSFWMFEELPDGYVEVAFYSMLDELLIFNTRAWVLASLPRFLELDTHIKSPIEMVFRD